MSDKDKRFASVSNGALEKWAAEFTKQCNGIWEATTPNDDDGSWLSFRKLWRWKRESTH